MNHARGQTSWRSQVWNARVWLVLLAIILSSDCGKTLERTLETVFTSMREVVIRLVHPNALGQENQLGAPQENALRIPLEVISGTALLKAQESIQSLKLLILAFGLSLGVLCSKRLLLILNPRAPPICG